MLFEWADQLYAWPRWAWMWVIAVALFFAIKAITWRHAQPSAAAWWQQAGYWLAWPGLNAGQFLSPRSFCRIKSPAAGEWLLAVAKTLLGAFLLWWIAPRVSSERQFLLGWTGMLGLIFLLHFGFFHLLSCAWRAAGVDARPLMHWPIGAASVSEFWGRRWNTAFRDFAHQYIFRPLGKRTSPRMAVVLGFLASGVIHDAVISVPAGGGFGGPTLYFSLQAVALLVEHSAPGKHYCLAKGLRSRAWVCAVTALPLCSLFHPAFVGRVIVPFMHAIGAC